MLHFTQDLETRKFLVGPETFGLKLLVLFLVLVSPKKIPHGAGLSQDAVSIVECANSVGFSMN